MHIKDQHPFYPTSDDERLQIRKELGFKESILQEDIDSIIEWFQKQPHLVDAPIGKKHFESPALSYAATYESLKVEYNWVKREMDKCRDYIEKTLMASKGSLEKAKRKIDNFYKYRSLAPELIQDRTDDLNDANYDPWTVYRQAAMLKLFNGKRISVFKLTEPNASKMFLEVILRNTIMLGDLRMKYDYMLGDIWIFDLQNASLSHLLRVNLLMFQKFVNILQDGIGIKVYEIHVINATSLGQSFINMLRQFVKPKIVEKIVTHKTTKELQEHIPKTYLPKDYGGDQPSLDEFKELYKREMKKDTTKNYLIGCCQQISDEKRRPGDVKEEYLVGSFKKLDFD